MRRPGYSGSLPASRVPPPPRTPSAAIRPGRAQCVDRTCACVHTRPMTQNPIPRRRRKYGLGKALIDLALILLTGGLWLLVILVRELRARS